MSTVVNDCADAGGCNNPLPKREDTTVINPTLSTTTCGTLLSSAERFVKRKRASDADDDNNGGYRSNHMSTNCVLLSLSSSQCSNNNNAPSNDDDADILLLSPPPAKRACTMTLTAVQRIQRAWRTYRRRYPTPLNDADPITLESWPEIRQQHEPIFIHVGYDGRLSKSVVYWFKATSLYETIKHTAKFINPITQVVLNNVELRRLQRILVYAAQQFLQDLHMKSLSSLSAAVPTPVTPSWVSIVLSELRSPLGLVQQKRHIAQQVRTRTEEQSMMDWMENILERLVIVGMRDMCRGDVSTNQYNTIWKAAIMRQYRELRAYVREHRSVFALPVEKLVQRAVEQAQKFMADTSQTTPEGLNMANRFVLYCLNINKKYMRIFYQPAVCSAKDNALRLATRNILDPADLLDQLENPVADSDDEIVDPVQYGNDDDEEGDATNDNPSPEYTLPPDVRQILEYYQQQQQIGRRLQSVAADHDDEELQRSSLSSSGTTVSSNRRTNDPLEAVFQQLVHVALTNVMTAHTSVAMPAASGRASQQNNHNNDNNSYDDDITSLHPQVNAPSNPNLVASSTTMSRAMSRQDAPSRNSNYNHRTAQSPPSRSEDRTLRRSVDQIARHLQGTVARMLQQVPSGGGDSDSTTTAATPNISQRNRPLSMERGHVVLPTTTTTSSSTRPLLPDRDGRNTAINSPRRSHRVPTVPHWRRTVILLSDDEDDDDYHNLHRRTHSGNTGNDDDEEDDSQNKSFAVNETNDRRRITSLPTVIASRRRLHDQQQQQQQQVISVPPSAVVSSERASQIITEAAVRHLPPSSSMRLNVQVSSATASVSQHNDTDAVQSESTDRHQNTTAGVHGRPRRTNRNTTSATVSPSQRRVTTRSMARYEQRG